MIWMVDAPAEAAVVAKTGDICVTADTNFDDLAGDNWTTNQARRARGFEFFVQDASGIRSGLNLNANGCIIDFPVDVEQNDGSFLLKVISKATVNGVDMESWEGDTPSQAVFALATFSISTGTGTTFSAKKNIATIDQRWTNLLVGTMVFKDYSWKIHQPVNRSCCTSNKSGDGTCASSNYQLIATPVQMQVRSGGSCCGSTLADPDPQPGAQSNFGPGLSVPTNSPYKFLLAHELGHVVVDMRMGGRSQTNLNAPLNDCQGMWSMAPSLLGQDAGGTMSKEFMAYALREGWANFVAAVTWNTRNEADCEYQGITVFHDLDLDGDIDTDRAGTTMDGALDCEGDPDLEAFGETLPTYINARNWLDDLESTSDIHNDNADCVRDGSSAHEANRSTTYDALRMFWDLTTDQGLSPGKLSDLFVDMCSRNWEAEDPFQPNAGLPLTRLGLSATANGISTELSQEVDHVEH